MLLLWRHFEGCPESRKSGRSISQMLIGVLCSVLFSTSPTAAATTIPVQPISSVDQVVLTEATLGILVNENDPESIELGREYAEIRRIPKENIILLKLPKVSFVARHLMVRELDRLRSHPIYSRLAGFVLAFERPYRVDANQSITSAISQGIATMRWQGNCNLTVSNPDAGKAPGAALTLKPSMMLTAGSGLADSIALAKRGSDAGRLTQDGQVVFWKTEDNARSKPREDLMDRATRLYGKQVDIVTAKSYESWKDTIGLQTGLAVLPDLDGIQFLPGAFADHLTSFGGVIEGKNSQTPATAWIKAGATASYGTVREPCNYPEKFPDPTKLLSSYLGGDSILEAYWKSVGMLTEGLFIGEPLARPFPLMNAAIEGNELVIRANARTVEYLRKQKRKAEMRGLKRSLRLGFFWVELGKPQLISDVDLDRPIHEDDVVLRTKVGSGPADLRRIGVLIRR